MSHLLDIQVLSVLRTCTAFIWGSALEARECKYGGGKQEGMERDEKEAAAGYTKEEPPRSETKLLLALARDGREAAGVAQAQGAPTPPDLSHMQTLHLKQH